MGWDGVNGIMMESALVDGRHDERYLMVVMMEVVCIAVAFRSVQGALLVDSLDNHFYDTLKNHRYTPTFLSPHPSRSLLPLPSPTYSSSYSGSFS